MKEGKVMKASKVISIALLLILFVPASAQQPQNMKNGHEYVDLGLSVNWATCNVGADKPEEYGDYYAWGETETKSTYDWSTYKYCNGAMKTMTKYCNDISQGNEGFTDNKVTLELADDVSHVKWGGNWRMPTDAEFKELLDNCTWTWTSQNGIDGYKVTSNKTGYTDCSIFLPATGRISDIGPHGVGSSLFYWSGSVDEYFCSGAKFLAGTYTSDLPRSHGYSIRPVYPKDNTENGYEYVDLGLSVNWATCNVGANKPEGYGGYYAWGETDEKETLGWTNYRFRVSGGENTYYNGDVRINKYNWLDASGVVDNKAILDLEDDVAHVLWKGNWRMPTPDEFNELRDYRNCTWTWTTLNGVKGNLITSKKPGYEGRSIFLPAAGWRVENNARFDGTQGCYWSRSLSPDRPLKAWILRFNDDCLSNMEDLSRCSGFSVRPVCPK